MNEEEIIKYLENVIKTIQESDMLFDEPANIRCGLKMEGAIQGLLDLYNKEKQKNKKFLENPNRALELEYNEKIKYLAKNYISKDKIREKIEKLINEAKPKYKRMRILEETIGMSEEEYKELQDLWEYINVIEIKIEGYKELLQEGDK